MGTLVQCESSPTLLVSLVCVCSAVVWLGQEAKLVPNAGAITLLKPPVRDWRPPWTQQTLLVYMPLVRMDGATTIHAQYLLCARRRPRSFCTIDPPSHALRRTYNVHALHATQLPTNPLLLARPQDHARRKKLGQLCRKKETGKRTSGGRVARRQRVARNTREL